MIKIHMFTVKMGDGNERSSYQEFHKTSTGWQLVFPMEAKLWELNFFKKIDKTGQEK